MLSIEYVRKPKCHEVALVEALRHRPEDRGVVSRRFLLFFNLFISSGCTTTLGSSQPLTKMSSRNIFWGSKGDRYLSLINSPLSYATVLKSANLILLETSGPAQASKGFALSCSLLCILVSEIYLVLKLNCNNYITYFYIIQPTDACNKVQFIFPLLQI